MSRVMVLNGPNLNLLIGSREPGLYGAATLEDIENALRTRAAALDITVAFAQSNHEGELVDLVQGLRGTADGAIVNLGAVYPHLARVAGCRSSPFRCRLSRFTCTNLFKREAASSVRDGGPGSGSGDATRFRCLWL